MAVKQGSKIKVDYVGTFDDGTVFDSSAKHGKPLEFEVGKHQVIPGFENAVIGMEKGQEKEIEIKPKDAYGEYDANLAKDFKREQLPKEPEPKPGMMLVLKTADGNQFPAMIKSVSNGKVTIDINHPLAGKTLHFKFNIVDIS